MRRQAFADTSHLQRPPAEAVCTMLRWRATRHLKSSPHPCCSRMKTQLLNALSAAPSNAAAYTNNHKPITDSAKRMGMFLGMDSATISTQQVTDLPQAPAEQHKLDQLVQAVISADLHNRPSPQPLPPWLQEVIRELMNHTSASNSPSIQTILTQVQSVTPPLPSTPSPLLSTTLTSCPPPLSLKSPTTIRPAYTAPRSSRSSSAPADPQPELSRRQQWVQPQHSAKQQPFTGDLQQLLDFLQYSATDAQHTDTDAQHTQQTTATSNDSVLPLHSSQPSHQLTARSIYKRARRHGYMAGRKPREGFPPSLTDDIQRARWVLSRESPTSRVALEQVNGLLAEHALSRSEWRQVFDLVREFHSLLLPSTLAACLYSTACCLRGPWVSEGGPGREELRAMLDWLLEGCGASSRALGARDVSRILHSLCTLHLDCPLLLLRLRARLPALLPHCTPGQMAACAWALAKLGLKAGGPRKTDLRQAEVDNFLIASMPQLHEFTPRQLVVLFWAISKFGAQPPKRWLMAFIRSVQPALPGCSALEVSMLLEASLAMNLHTHHNQWVGDLLASLLPGVDAFGVVDLAVTFRCLAQLPRDVLSTHMSEEFQLRAVALLREQLSSPAAGPKEVSALLHACGRLELPLDERLVGRMARRFRAMAHACAPHQVSQAVWGLGRALAGCRLSKAMRARLREEVEPCVAHALHVAQPRLGGYKRLDLVQLIEGLAYLRHVPSQEFLAEYEACLLARPERFYEWAPGRGSPRGENALSWRLVSRAYAWLGLTPSSDMAAAVVMDSE